MSPLPLGLDQLQLRSFLPTFFLEYFFKTKGNIAPALLTLHRRKCETSTAEVTLLSLPRASSQPPFLRENTAASSATPRIREQGGSRAQIEREGWETLKAFCSVPLVHFPFVYMTLYPGRVAGPPQQQPPRGAASPCHPQYHTFFIMALYCSNQYAQYMLNVY